MHDAVLRRLEESKTSFGDIWLKTLNTISTENKVVQAPKKKSEETKTEPEVDTDSYKLRNADGLQVPFAGMVLLQPFILSLFNNLGLLQEGLFTGDDTRERAVCLLHYLATGSEEFPEPRLTLPKFLCHWPQDKPISRFLAVSDYEKEECLTVLQSAINHWEALKNTSVEGLRNGFLKREGILKEEAFGWSLYVEQKTQDIFWKSCRGAYR